MSASGQDKTRRLVYCNCTYAKVVPKDVREKVLERLSASGVAFEAVADLCEMSARKDPALSRIPVVVFTTSNAEEDIIRSYDLGVNSFITKPVTFDQVIVALHRYWSEIVTVPNN